MGGYMIRWAGHREGNKQNDYLDSMIDYDFEGLEGMSKYYEDISLLHEKNPASIPPSTPTPSQSPSSDATPTPREDLGQDSSTISTPPAPPLQTRSKIKINTKTSSSRLRKLQMFRSQLKPQPQMNVREEKKFGEITEDEKWLTFLALKESEIESVPKIALADPLSSEMKPKMDVKDNEFVCIPKKWFSTLPEWKELGEQIALSFSSSSSSSSTCSSSIAALQQICQSIPLKTPSFRMYVVYHKRLENSMYAALSRKNFDFLEFFKVNEQIPYELGLSHEADQPPLSVNVRKESSLKIYSSWLQEKGFNELSCILHVYCNGLYKKYDYIGVCQYDMKITDSHIQTWCEWMRTGMHSHLSNFIDTTTTAADILALPACDITFHAFTQTYVEDHPWHGFPMDFVLSNFCSFFDIKRHSLLQLILRKIQYNTPLYLYNTFLIRQDIFIKLCSWLLHLYPLLYTHTETQRHHRKHKGHYGGIIERCISIFFLWNHQSTIPISDIGLRNVNIPEIHRSKFGQY